MTEAEQDQMAAKFFGFGNWDADVWFIGPEQGMSKDDTTLLTRFEAWKRMGSQDLLDCRKYHEEIAEHRFHTKGSNGKVEPQHTWRKLIRTGLAYRGIDADQDAVLNYQANGWGSAEGNDCVIELSGLPAHSQGVKRAASADVLSKRIDEIAMRLASPKYKIVLLYGGGRNNNCAVAWQRLTHGLEKRQFGLFTICESANATFVRCPHPTASIKGNSNEEWIGLGKRLAELRKAASHS
jgi:hypothetical protein